MAIYLNQNLYPGEFLLHKKYAATEMLLDLVWTHCNIVAEICMWLLTNNDFDKTELVREYVLQAALIHDIGVYSCGGFEWIPNQPPSDRPYIQHGIIGAWILQQEGYAAPIVQVAYCHTGVGLSVDDIRSHGLNLPEQDFVPQTMLQKFIMYASKFHSKAPKFHTPEQIKESLGKFSLDKVAVFEDMERTFGTPHLEDIEKKYAEWHRSFNFKVQELSKVSKSVNLNPAGITTAHS
jgi:uncharacterized protein